MTKLEEKNKKQAILEMLPILVYVGTLLAIVIILYLWLLGVI